MATGFPVKGTGGSSSYVNGTSLSASDLNDGFGTLNLLASFYTGNPQLIGALEKCNIVGAAPSSTQNIDAITSTVWYFNSNATTNFTINFRGSSGTALNSVLSTGQSITAVALVQNGATPYYPTAYQVDGSAVTPKWSGGSAPAAGNASATDIYIFTILKTASATFTVFASQTKFA